MASFDRCSPCRKAARAREHAGRAAVARSGLFPAGVTQGDARTSARSRGPGARRARASCSLNSGGRAGAARISAAAEPSRWLDLRLPKGRFARRRGGGAAACDMRPRAYRRWRASTRAACRSAARPSSSSDPRSAMSAQARTSCLDGRRMPPRAPPAAMPQPAGGTRRSGWRPRKDRRLCARISVMARVQLREPRLTVRKPARRQPRRRTCAGRTWTVGYRASVDCLLGLRAITGTLGISRRNAALFHARFRTSSLVAGGA